MLTTETQAAANDCRVGGRTSFMRDGSVIEGAFPKCAGSACQHWDFIEQRGGKKRRGYCSLGQYPVELQALGGSFPVGVDVSIAGDGGPAPAEDGDAPEPAETETPPAASAAS